MLSAQRDIEKTQKRTSQGAKKGNQGGMPRVLLGAKQHREEIYFSSKLAQYQSKLTHIEQQLQALKSSNVAKPIQFGFRSEQQKNKRILYVKNITLPYVNQAISMDVKQGENGIFMALMALENQLS